MKTFFQFIIERAPDALETTKKPTVMANYGVNAERHIRQYASPDKIASTHYTLDRNAGNLESGSKVKIHSIEKHESGKYHAMVSSPDNPSEKHVVPLSHIQKPVQRGDIRKKESHFVNDLHNQITSSKQPVHMYDSNGVKHHIVGAHQIPGNPKADIALVNHKGEHVIHISHKESEESHQGYGGMNSKANASHPVMKEFADKLKKKVEDTHMGLKGKSRTMTLDHNNPHHSDMIKSALFGKNHSSNKSGVENVDFISHGKMNLKFNKHGVASIHSEKDISRKNYRDQKYEITAKHATDRTIPGTNIGGIVGITHAGHRKGRDVTSVEDNN